MAEVEIPINNATELTPTDSDASSATPTQVFLISCTAAGAVSLDLAGGATIVLYVEKGCSFLPMSVVRVNVTGTTATATYYNLRSR